MTANKNRMQKKKKKTLLDQCENRGGGKVRGGGGQPAALLGFHHLRANLFGIVLMGFSHFGPPF